MTTRAVDEVERAAGQPIAARPRGPVSTGTPGADPLVRSVLALQASAGNHAVGHAIDWARARPGPAPVSTVPVVQREEEPAWLGEAQEEFRQLFPKEKLMQGVVIKDYADLNDTLQGMGYGAWTQSQTEIFIRDPMTLGGVTKRNRRSMLRYILQHEAVHVRQFSSKGPPTTWQRMIEHEVEAYGSDKTWLAANAKAIPDRKLRDKLTTGVAKNLKTAGEILRKAAKTSDPEAFLYEEMKKQDFIPKDAARDPRELYKQ